MSTRIISPGPESTVHQTLVSRGATPVGSTPNERAELLDDVDWARRLPWGRLTTLARYLERYRLDAGRFLFREGDRDAFLAIVVSGEVEIRKRDLEEQERRVTAVLRRKMIGEMSLLDGAARSASAVAAEATDLLVLTKEDFARMAEHDPALALELTLVIATTIAQLLRQTTGALVDHLDA